MLFRFLIASATLVVIGVIKKIKPPKLRDVPKFSIGGFIGIFLYMYLSKTGLLHVESGVGSFIVASVPVFTIILSRVFLKEKAGLFSWIGVAISFCGLVIITLSQTEEFTFNVGVLLLILSALASSIYTIIQRELLKIHSALETTTYCVLAATVVMLIYLPGLIREIPGSTAGLNLTIVFLGVFPAALAYLTWAFALSGAKNTTSVTVFLYLMPFITSVLAYLWLRETLTVWALIGGMVIIGGMVLTNVRGNRRKSGKEMKTE